MSALETLRGRLIVSCQAWEDDPFHAPGLMARFARAAVAGGAAGIRANGPEDVREIRAATGVPVIAIQKRAMEDGRILITPTFDDARALADSGAAVIALDCTARGQHYGALGRLARIRSELALPVAADIATLDEALAAQAAGADFVLCTMRGYSGDTVDVTRFEPAFVAELVRRMRVPVIAEGRIRAPHEALAALDAGAFAVVVGSAITRPRDITARFARALAPWSVERACFLGIDLGGTNLKSGLVTADGAVTAARVEPTRAASRGAVLAQLAATAARLVADAASLGLTPLAAGIATPGWPDPVSGEIVFGTGNLPEWTGARLRDAVAPVLAVPVFIENDANAAAAGERCFGAARSVDTFLCVTVGTGIGGGCFAGGRLLRGGRLQGNQLGHIVIEPDGALCTCGQRGCVEQYANADALLRYAGHPAGGVREVLAAVHSGDVRAREAVVRVARELARGLAPAVQVLDPGLIVLAGGVAQENPLLAEALSAGLAERVPNWTARRIDVRISALGYHGGVSGAGAVARAGLAE